MMLRYAAPGAGADASATFALRGDHALEFLNEEDKRELLGLFKAIPQTADGLGGLDAGGLSHTTVSELALPDVRIDRSVLALNPLKSYAKDEAWSRWVSTQKEMVKTAGNATRLTYADFRASMATAYSPSA